MDLQFIPFAAGLGVAAAIAVSARIIKFDQDRSFFPTLLIVIASYYVLFAVWPINPSSPN